MVWHICMSQRGVCVCVCVSVCVSVCLCTQSNFQLFAIPWTVAHQLPLSEEFSRQQYCSGLPFPNPADGSAICANRLTVENIINIYLQTYKIIEWQEFGAGLDVKNHLIFPKERHVRNPKTRRCPWTPVIFLTVTLYCLMLLFCKV